MAESSRGPLGQTTSIEPDETLIVDMAAAMRDYAKLQGFEFDSQSDSDSDLVSPVSAFTEEDHDAARAECRELGLQGDPADYYINEIAMPRKKLAVRKKRVAQRERRISRHHPKVDMVDWYKYQTDYLTKRPFEPASPGEDLTNMPRDLADRRIAIRDEEKRLDRREWEAGKYEYIVFNSETDPTDFLRQHDKLKTAKEKLEEKLSKASDVREEALAAVKELPEVQKQLEQAHAEVKSLDDMVDYENRRATHLEEEMQKLQQKDREMQDTIKLYQARETELQDVLRNQKYELEQEMDILRSKLYPLEVALPEKERRIQELESRAKKDLETIKELTDYGEKTGKSLKEAKQAEAVSREQAEFYHGIFSASNEAANFHAAEAEEAKADAKGANERYENAKIQVEELDEQLADALQKFHDAEEEVRQVKAELQQKEDELSRVSHRLDLVYREERRASVSTSAPGSARGYASFQDEPDFSEPSKSPTLSSLRARVTELEAEVESKRSEVGDHKTKLEAKEAEVNKTYKELKEKATEISNLAQTVKELTADNEQLRASAEKGRRELAAKSSEDEDRYARLYYIHDSLKKDCFDACHKISGLTERMEDKAALIKKQLADSHCALLEAAKDSSDKTKELARLSAELQKIKSTHAGAYESLSRNFGILHSQLKEMNKEKQARIAKIAQLKEDLASRPDPDTYVRLASVEEDYGVLKDIHDKMKEALNTAAEENAILKADRDRLSVNEKALNDEIDNLENERDKLTKDLEVSTKDLDRLQDTRDQMAENLESKINEANGLKDERDRAADNLEALTNELNSLKDERDRMTKEIEDLRAANARHELWKADNGNAARKLLLNGQELIRNEEQLSEAKMNNAAKNTEINELKADLDKKKSALQAIEEQLETANKQAAELGSSVRDLKAKLAAAKHEAAKSTFTIAGLKERIAELEQELTASHNDTDELESEIAQLREQLEALRLSDSEKEDEASAIQKKLKDAKAAAAAMEAKAALLEKQLSAATSRVTEMESKIEQLEEQLESIKSTAEDDLEKSNNRAAELESEIVQLEKQLEAAQNNADDDLEKSNNQVAELESKMAHLQEQLQATKDAARDEKSKTENDLAESKNRAAELDARITKLEEKLQAVEQEKSRLEYELAKSNDRAAELDSETAGLKEQLKQQDESIRDQRVKVDEATKTAAKATEDLNNLENERLNAVNRLEETDRKLQRARRLCFHGEELANSLQCDLDMAEKKHAEDLAEKQAEIDGLNGKIAALEKERMDPEYVAKFVNTMESGSDNLEQAKNRAEQAVVARDEQIKELEGELETTKQIATDMGLQLYDMENEIKDLQKSRDKSDAAYREKLDLMTKIRTRLQELLKKANDCQASVEQKVANLNTLLQESRDSAAKAGQELDGLKDELKECSAKLLAEEAKSARQAGQITELEKDRAQDCEVNLANVQQLEADIRQLQDDVAKRAAKEKQLEDLVKSKEEEIKTLEADKSQSDEQSQRILELQKSLAEITEQQTQNGQASVAAAQELQTKLGETKAMNDQLVKDLMQLTDKAATWDVKEKDFKDLIQLQVQTVKSLQDQLKQTILQYRAIVTRSMGDAAVIQNLRSDTSKLWSDLVDATRENTKLRQKLKDLGGQPKAEEELCYTCGRVCKCPIAVSEASGFFDQWLLVFMAIWGFLEMMPENTKMALLYLLGLLGLPGRCWKTFVNGAKSRYGKRYSSKGKARAAGAPGDQDWDWPTLPTVPHAAMVYCLIFWGTVLAFLISAMSFWATSVERHLWLHANTNTRAYFNFGRREGAPGACLVPQLLPIDYRFVYEPTYGNFCGFVERQTGDDAGTEVEIRYFFWW
ncbi:hypothetical protein MCOR25_006100 [Pyricularia grisea]|nr:hypothetical protein MCOR25_006100 [Pyricularia grisea]